MNKKNGLSLYHRRKPISLVCADLIATHAVLITGLNRNTVNRYFRLALAGILTRIPDYRITKLNELLPWQWNG